MAVGSSVEARKTGSCHQLWLLLARNTLIRWRGGSVTIKSITIPLFQLLEVIWPLVLYAILAILRKKFPPENIPDLKYRAFALPSAGPLPFLQSLFCDFGTGRDDGSFSDMPNFPNATVNGLYTVLDEIGTWNASWTEVCDSIHALADQASCLNYTLTAANAGCSVTGADLVPLSCYLNNATEFEDYLNGRLGLSQEVVDGILGATINTSEVSPSSLVLPANLRVRRQAGSSEGLDLSSILQNFGYNTSITKVLVCSSDQLDEFIHYSNISAADVRSELCNLSDSQWLGFGQQLQQQIAADCSPMQVAQSVSEVLGLQHLLEQSSLVEFIQGFSEAEWTVQDSAYNDTEEENGDCQNDVDKYVPFFCGSLRKKASGALKAIFDRSCSGDSYRQAERERARRENKTVSANQNSLKILYAPYTNLTLSIIKKANRTFETAGDLIALADQVANCSQFFLDNFHPAQLETVSKQLQQSIESGVVSPLFSNVSVDTLIKAQDLLNVSQPNNIWSIMSTVYNVSTNLRDGLAKFDWDIFLHMESEQELEELAGDYQQQDELGITYVIAGIVFDPNLPTSKQAFKNTTIRIRTNFSSVVDTSEYRENIWYPGPENNAWKARYLDGFFIFVQDMIERAVMEEILGHRMASPGVYLQEMPYPCFKSDEFTISLLYVLPLAMLFAWLFPVAMTARAVVREKETRLKEYMKMMGVGEGLLRLSWFLHSMGVLLISVVFITLLLKLSGVLPATDGFILFLFLTLYAVVMLSYSFLVSVFFNNANLAACVAALIYFLVFFAHMSIVPNLRALSPVVIGLCCLWAPLAFGLAATFLVQWELKQQGIIWNNVAIPAIDDDHLSFLVIVFIMGLDAVLYFVLTWYLEGVFPGRYGVSKPWYFPFMPSYWRGQRRADKEGGITHVNLQEDEEELTPLSDVLEESRSGSCEDDPDGLPLGISIQGLSKDFSTGLLPGRRRKTLAVNDLSLNFYEGQITAFLGHNGAGKTTTMSVLTGLFEPSRGTAHIYGNNIRNKMDVIRQSLGICPQHNILIDQLTVEEHLLFYGQLKGLSYAEAKVQVPMWLKKVDLNIHAKKYSKHLSGGMKRKLSILLAFIGNCNTIILDEPTSGVDPYSRQQIWDFLLQNREGRTIMLSTHHMDEAEILGDRIAIISKGSLLCCGSFDYLKHHFGQGHRLTLVTKVQSDRRPSTASRTFTVTAEVEEPDHAQVSPSSGAPDETVFGECIEAELTTFVERIVTGATLIERRGREVHYRLPLLHARPSILASLFTQLDEQKERLGIMSYGLSSCTMEEIFVELTEQNLTEENTSVPGQSLRSVNSQTSLDTIASDTNAFEEEGLLFGDVTCDDPLGSGLEDVNSRLTLGKLWLVQFYALLVKRLHYSKGKLIALTVQNVFPLLVICISLLIARALQTVPNPPALELSPNLFFAKSHYNYLFAGGYYTDATAPFVESLFQPCGVAAHSVGSSVDINSTCFHAHSKTDECPLLDYPQQQYSCTCASCQRLSSSTPSCYNGTVTGSRILNLTQGFDPLAPDDEYYSMHAYLLRSSTSFIEQRYGGVSYGHFKPEVATQVDELNADSSSSLPFLATHSVAKVWYSFKGYHAMPAYLNTMNNAILRGSLNQVDRSEYGIRTVSHPFNLTDIEKPLYAITENFSFLVNPLAAIFCLGFVVSGFVLLLIEEKSGNIKHLQLVCGMNKFVYWLSTFLWDLLWYSVFIVLMVILFLLFQDPYYTGSGELPVFILLLLCYGLAAIPWVYMFSFVFSSSATAYVLLFCLNFFSGFSLLIIDAIVVQLEKRDGDNLLHYYLLGVPFPSYALARSMMYLNLDRPLAKSFNTYSSDPLPNPYSELAPFMASLLVQCLCYSSVVFIVESFPVITNVFNKFIGRKNISLHTPCNEDEAVAKERRQVMSSSCNEDLLVLRNLTKVYGNRWSSQYRLAVNQLCLRMKKAECFGLLGVNGAGKTSTFRMLTGDTFVTSGEANIGSQHMGGGRRAIVGYCPQVDALIDTLTGRQHLTLYSRLRGLPTADVNKVVEWALIKLGLKEHADKQVKAYSGGNRRKLSAAIALLARPALILLDEPTSGVDPRARQFLWAIVRGLVSAGQSVLLTTHSMAECEALCSRVGIMVNGSFRCLGSPQQLKSTYGQGYRLKIRAGGQIEPVREFIRQNMSTAILKEEHYNTLLYQLPSVGLNLPSVYNIMESSKETLNIEDYTLSQTTLNDVFIHFANEQREDVGLQAFETSSPTVPQGTNLPDILTDILS